MQLIKRVMSCVSMYKNKNSFHIYCLYQYCHLAQPRPYETHDCQFLQIQISRCTFELYCKNNECESLEYAVVSDQGRINMAENDEMPLLQGAGFKEAEFKLTKSFFFFLANFQEDHRRNRLWIAAVLDGTAAYCWSIAPILSCRLSPKVVMLHTCFSQSNGGTQSHGSFPDQETNACQRRRL